MIEPAINFDKLLELAPLRAARSKRRTTRARRGARASESQWRATKPSRSTTPRASPRSKPRGAEIVTFSPLNDERIPECGGLIFGGGFPEIFAARLAANKTMKASMRSRRGGRNAHIRANAAASCTSRAK